MHGKGGSLGGTLGSLLAAGALLAVVVLLVPEEGLGESGKWILGIIAMTAVLWAFSPMENAAVTLLMLGGLTLAGLPPHQTMSGFASGGFWILLTVLFYGYAMSHTGLAKRISFSILNLFPPSYASILFSFFIIGLTLSLGIPSMTVRTAIMVPIGWALVQAIGLPARSPGSALIILSCVEMAVLPGCAFLYGSLWGPVVDRLFSSAGLPLSWLGYAQVLTPPTLLWCVVLLLVNLWLLAPAEPLRLDGDFSRRKLAELGSWKRSEVITASVIGASILFWVLDSFHGLPSFTPGLFAVPLLSLAGILNHQAFSTGVPWPLLLFLGGIFSMTEVLEANHINIWLARYLVPLVEPFLLNTLLLVMLLAVAMVCFKFFDPTGFLAITALFVPLHAPLAEAGIAPLALTAVLILPGHPFWASYQNIWVAMSEGITDRQAFSGRQRVIFATVYFLVTLLILLVSWFYWRALGIL